VNLSEEVSDEGRIVFSIVTDGDCVSITRSVVVTDEKELEVEVKVSPESLSQLGLRTSHCGDFSGPQ
jgi:GTP-sensing pleiotropic transcriptional regulator CodY